MHNHVEAVLLDMDGLLLDTERLAWEGYEAAFASQEVECPKELLMTFIGRSEQHTYRLLVEFFQDEQKATTVFKHADAHYTNSKPLLKKGVLALLDFLEREKLPWAIATSSSRAHAHLKLESVDILKRVKHLITADDVKNAKPAPDLFLKAAQTLGVANQRACLVLEDSEAGVRAAHAAKMMPIMIPDIYQPSEALLPLTHAVLPSLDDFIIYFQDHFCKAG
jgi:HAD superfamily hydrolase (TIGR01509 family)